ncbi:hypothetical protein CPC08DRAFT_715289 [Agrocybe pediades]|nr:hypothetical protein CPC08DRAFT_715289 [Agrocybe pediades]
MFGRMTKPRPLDIPYPYSLGLADLLACLRRIVDSHVLETSMAAAYHCFLRVALSIEDRFNDSDTSDPTDNPLYYLSVMINEDMERDQPLSGCLDTPGVRQSLHSPALRYQALASFVSTPWYRAWFSHYLELHILLKRWMYSDHRKLETSVLLGSVALPAFVRTRLVAVTIPTQTPAVDSPLFLTNPFHQMPSEASINDYCAIYVSFFTCISKGDQYRDWTTSIHMTPEATELLTDAASVGHHNLLAPTSIAIANIIIECLQTYLDVPSNERNGDSTTYNLLLYAASIYLSAFPRNPPNPWTPSMLSVYNKLEEARIALIRYKAEVLDVVGQDQAIERRFVEYYRSSFDSIDRPLHHISTSYRTQNVSQLPRRFTTGWWRFLEEPFLYRAGEEVRIGTGQDGMPITTTFIIPDLPSTS